VESAAHLNYLHFQSHLSLFLEDDDFQFSSFGLLSRGNPLFSALGCTSLKGSYICLNLLAIADFKEIMV